jgi:NAD(P)-dependent dehydrogenase (short-subunit alcohol dehydrogenase family)
VSGRFESKVVIVTGAGHGIGEAVAMRFAGEGATVVVCDIDADRAERVTAAIRTTGASAQAEVVDVADADAAAGMVTATAQRCGAIDVLVNNAAIATYEAACRHFLEGDQEWWQRIVTTNLGGVFHCSQPAARLMARRRRGVIINMSSGGASRAHRAMASYDAAKGGVEAVTRAMALDLAPYGIRVNYIVPGLIRTYDISDELAVERGSVVPMGRLGDADDVAGPTLFLASDDARYVTGAGLVVDGGVLVQQRSAPVDVYPPSRFPQIDADRSA